MRRGHIFVEGRVQGVGYRHFTTVNATELDMFGWVKNLPDGRVEAIFEGSEEDINKIVKRCKNGPRAGRVDNVNFEWEEPTGKFTGFNVHY